LRFTTAEDAGGHCEMMNRSRHNRIALGWLDEMWVWRAVDEPGASAQHRAGRPAQPSPNRRRIPPCRHPSALTQGHL